MHNPNAIAHRIKWRFLDLVREYIQEGEHQDGEHFWDNFHDGMQVAEDFGRFIEGKKELQLTPNE